MQLALVTVALSANIAMADVATWEWAISDTGNGDGLIEPGESALLILSVTFDPSQPQEGGGLAWAGPYDILGDVSWSQGQVAFYDNLIDDATDDGFLATNNDILGVEHFQYPLWFGDDFRAGNPLAVYKIRWTPTQYSTQFVSIDNLAPDAWIYTDPFGERSLYAGEGGSVSFSVVPAPSAAVAVAITLLNWAPRRQSLT